MNCCGSIHYQVWATVKAILAAYEEALGQRINLDKLGIFFSLNLMEGDRQLMSESLEIPSMKLDSKYLGLPSFWGKSKKELTYQKKKEELTLF